AIPVSDASPVLACGVLITRTRRGWQYRSRSMSRVFQAPDLRRIGGKGAQVVVDEAESVDSAAIARRSTGKRDCVEMPAIVGLARADGAGNEEKGRRPGMGAGGGVVDPADAGPAQARCDVAREIKQSMAGARPVLEEALVLGIVLGELRHEFGPDLVV